MIPAPGTGVGQVVVIVLEIVNSLSGNQELPVLYHFPEALDQILVPAVGGRAVPVAVAGVKAAQGGGMVQAFVVQNAVRAQLHTLLELRVANFPVFFSPKAHGDKPPGIDVGELGQGHVLVALIHVIILVGVLDGQLLVHVLKVLIGLIGPHKLGE